MRKAVVTDEIKRLRSEVNGLSVVIPHERKMYELLMAQICILEKILREEEERWIKNKSNKS